MKHRRARTLPLFAPSRTAYVGNAWSGLDAAGKSETTEVVENCSAELADQQFSVFASMEQVPPGTRHGFTAGKLWDVLRGQMETSDLFVGIFSGQSQGLLAELHNASDFLVPSVLMFKQGISRHELTWLPGLVSIGQFSYDTPTDARTKLAECIKTHSDEIAARTNRRQHSGYASNARVIGDAIRAARESRGWDRQRLAGESGVPTGLIARIEDSPAVLNPAFAQVFELSASLGMSVDELGQTPFQRRRNRLASLVWAVAREDRWLAAEVEDFTRSYYCEIGAQAALPPTKQQVRQEMRRWRGSRGR